MENLQAVNMGVNVITLRKDNDFYAMTCAWMIMVDYDKLLCLLGSQSKTGKAIKKGDIIGVSALAKGMQKEANFFGDAHSNEVDKKNMDYLETFYNVLVVKNSKVKMQCEVLDILKPQGLENDSLLYLKIVQAKTDAQKEFLALSDF